MWAEASKRWLMWLQVMILLLQKILGDLLAVPARPPVGQGEQRGSRLMVCYEIITPESVIAWLNVV
jgi:hypothetical protein